MSNFKKLKSALTYSMYTCIWIYDIDEFGTFLENVN